VPPATSGASTGNPPLALPLPVSPVEPAPSGLAAHRIRRCTFRRLIQLEVAHERVTDVQCLLPDRRLPIPLGDMESATPICNSCTAAHIFRPDED
jgi:hypothetical protein